MKNALLSVLLLLVMATYLPPQQQVAVSQDRSPDQVKSFVGVVVRYDPDHDGVYQDVGPGRVTEARRKGVIVAISQTDDDGVAYFVLPYGVYEFSTWVGSTRFFYYWECLTYDVVDEPGESFLTFCKERFFLRLPFSSSGTVVE